MSDYFTALTRSAGPVLERREPARGQPDMVEQDVVRESESGGVTQESSTLPHPAPATFAAEVRSQGAEPATTAAEIHRQEEVPVTKPAAPPPQRMPVPAAASAPAAAELPEAFVRNAAVSAALRWVAADPARQQPSSTIPAIDEAPRRTIRPAIDRQVDALPPVMNDTDSSATEPASLVIQTPSPPARDHTHRRERARSLAADATVVDRRTEEMPRLDEERVDVSIGTIHVRVDAPSPPAVVAQPTQASRSGPEPRERSSFPRCRIPRI